MNRGQWRVGREQKLVGSSAVMQRVRETLEALAHVRWPVRIEGPTGSGKTLAARVLHEASGRKGGFLSCSVGMLAQGLEIGELVGHARGSFTGAVSEQIGLFEAANEGTLLIDEIDTASPTVQRALLPLVEGGVVRRIGDRRDRRVSVRLVFATNADLLTAVVEGRFRHDLYQRLGLLVVHMPPLAEHREDIPDLAKSIMHKKLQEIDGSSMVPPRLEPAVLRRLVEYDWPGNVRELQHVIEHYLALGHLPSTLTQSMSASSDWRDRLDLTLRRFEGNKTKAAQALGISRNTLYKELRRRSS